MCVVKNYTLIRFTKHRGLFTAVQYFVDNRYQVQFPSIAFNHIYIYIYILRNFYVDPLNIVNETINTYKHT